MNKSIPIYTHVFVSIVLASFLTVVSYTLVASADPPNFLEFVGVITAYSCTYLCVVGSRINYPIGAASVAAFAVLFYQTGLNASAALQLYLLPVLVYGWFRWRSDDDPRPVEHVSLKWLPAYGFFCAVSYGVVIWINGLTGGVMTKFDTGIFVLTILAQSLLDNKKIETWLVWAIVNVLAIYVYWNSGLKVTAIQYCFFLANTVAGYVVWRSAMKRAS